MAIKGKSKGRGARTVARGPKPVYTPVRRRFWQRRPFWYGVLAVLGIAAVVVVILGTHFLRERGAARRKAAAASGSPTEPTPATTPTDHERVH